MVYLFIHLFIYLFSYKYIFYYFCQILIILCHVKRKGKVTGVDSEKCKLKATFKYILKISIYLISSILKELYYGATVLV